jgi:hypothetical protein
MATPKFWLGMLVMVFGMTVVGCDNDPPPPGVLYDDRLVGGLVSLNNDYPVVGETITASYHGPSSSNPAPIGTPSWTWYKTSQDNSSLSGVTNKTSIGYGTTYTVKQTDVGSWIWAEVSYSGRIGTQSKRTSSTVIGIPATATVSVSVEAVRILVTYIGNHRVKITLTLSDGRWNNVSYGTAEQWFTITGSPTVSSWYTGYQTPSVLALGRKLEILYATDDATTLPIGLTVALNTDTAQLSTMRSNTNVYNTLTAGTITASVSQWTLSQSQYED